MQETPTQPSPTAPQISVASDFITTVPQEILDSIEQAIEQELDRNTNTSKLTIGVPGYAFTWQDLKTISKQFSRLYGIPILIFPQNPIMTQLPNASSEFRKGLYCEIEFLVFTTLGLDNNRTLTQLTRTYEYTKDGQTNFLLAFPDDKIKASFIDRSDLSMDFEGYGYVVQVGDANIHLFSRTKLELGRYYRAGGMAWSGINHRNTLEVKIKDNFFIADWVVNNRELIKFSQSFFDKFKGLSIDKMIKAVAYPYENAVEDYRQLLFVSVFYLKILDNIPFNVMIMGTGGLGKTAYLNKLSAISGDIMGDSGGSSIKGLMPSFSSLGKQPGQIASARHFVLLNEFFNLVRYNQGSKGGFQTEMLNDMKQIVEGKESICATGNGKMKVRMRGSMFIVSNWIADKDMVRQSNVPTMYRTFDPALLDRFIIYPVPTIEQEALKNLHNKPVKALLAKEAKRLGIDTTSNNIVPILAKITDPYCNLTAEDLSGILIFKEKLSPIFTPKAEAQSTKCVVEFKKEGYNAGIHSRAEEFIDDIATAYAFQEALSSGIVNNDTEVIEVNEKHVIDAYALYRMVIRRHTDNNLGGSKMARREYAENGSTIPQRWIIQKVKEQFKTAVDRKIVLDDLVQMFKRENIGVDWELNFMPLLEKRILLCDGFKVIWLHDGLEDDVVNSMFVGGQELIDRAETLLEHGLIESGSDGNLRCPWIDVIPRTPFQGNQNSVMQSIDNFSQLTGDATDEQVIGSVKHEITNEKEILDILKYLHLSGKVFHSSKGYVRRIN